MFDRFIHKLKESMAKNLILGNGADANSTLGPLINDKNLNKVSDVSYLKCKIGILLS